MGEQGRSAQSSPQARPACRPRLSTYPCLQLWAGQAGRFPTLKQRRWLADITLHYKLGLGLASFLAFWLCQVFVLSLELAA